MSARARVVAILATGLLLLVVAGSSCSSASSPSASPSGLYPAGSATKISARDLYTAYRKDEAAADDLYKGKVLEVTGDASIVGTDPLFQAPEVVLSGGEMDLTRGVDCIYDPRYAATVAEIEPGQKVTVVGTCDGFAVNVLLTHCQTAQ